MLQRYTASAEVYKDTGECSTETLTIEADVDLSSSSVRGNGKHEKEKRCNYKTFRRGKA